MDLVTIATGFGLKILTALIAFVIVRLTLSNLDKVVGFDFKDWIEDADDNAKATYLGARIIAICLLFGVILL